MIAFGEILAELRQDRKMTQKDLAQAMFVTVGTISNYENGVHYPDVEKLISLADYFNVTTDYLLGRCKANVSPDVFDESIIGEKTMGQLVNDIRNLSRSRRQSLAIILDDMKLATMVNRYNREK
jgi:transcriptional regulator with XRE-family HTH domain